MSVKPSNVSAGTFYASASLHDDSVPRYGELILRLLAQTLTGKSALILGVRDSLRNKTSVLTLAGSMVA